MSMVESCAITAGVIRHSLSVRSIGMFTPKRCQCLYCGCWQEPQNHVTRSSRGRIALPHHRHPQHRGHLLLISMYIVLTE